MITGRLEVFLSQLKNIYKKRKNFQQFRFRICKTGRTEEGTAFVCECPVTQVLL